MIRLPAPAVGAVGGHLAGGRVVGHDVRWAGVIQIGLLDQVPPVRVVQTSDGKKKRKTRKVARSTEGRRA